MRHFNKFKSHLNVTNKIRLPVWKMNQPYATLTLASALREMFGVQLYKNNARALLSRILSILNLDWLQHARSVRGVYEFFKRPYLYKQFILLCVYVFCDFDLHKFNIFVYFRVGLYISSCILKSYF